MMYERKSVFSKAIGEQGKIGEQGNVLRTKTRKD